MATSNRAAILTKAHKVLKKHFTPVKPPDGRSVLEQLLYACCLENGPYAKADEVFARVQDMFFDWNEVRVTTISELSDVMKGLPDAVAAAACLKQSLQSVFESQYSFDLESLRKQNIGKAAKQLAKYRGVSHFAVAYATQNALGGHAIPVDKAAMDVLVLLGVLTEAEAAKGNVPGLERAIPKSKGVEFGSLLHQLAADYHASPFSPAVRSIILAVAPDAKERFPKRTSRKTAAKEPSGKETAQKKSAASKKGDKADKQAQRAAPADKKRTTSAKKTAASSRKKSTAKSAKKQSPTTKKKSASKRLAKKKPR